MFSDSAFTFFKGVSRFGDFLIGLQISKHMYIRKRSEDMRINYTMFADYLTNLQPSNSPIFYFKQIYSIDFSGFFLGKLRLLRAGNQITIF